MNSPPSKPLEKENQPNLSSSPRITPTQPCMASSPHLSLLSHNPKPIDTLIRETPSQNILNQTPLTATGLDTPPLEYTLNALSIFQKPVQLFFESQLPIPPQNQTMWILKIGPSVP
jgi:hypothetical protein